LHLLSSSSSGFGSIYLIKFNAAACSKGRYKVVAGSQRRTGKETLLRSLFINLPIIFQIGTEKFSGSR